MKVNIGPYTSFHSGLRLENAYINWRYKKHYYSVDLEEGDLLDKAVFSLLDKIIRPLCNMTINKFNNWRGRKIDVKIDTYDTWSMDSTLAYIIAPMLVQLKETKMGSPYVDPEDVPDHLRPTKEACEENNFIDDTHDKRWEWVLDEMIWTFKIYNTDWEMDYYTPPEGAWSLENRGVHDHEGRKEVQDRISRGFRLFGKYYQDLWD